MMRKRWIPMIILVAITLGCSGVQVSQDYEPGANLTTLRTYQWKSSNQEKTGDPRIDNPLRDERIRAAVDRQLTDKGFVKTENQKPDFLVLYQNILRQKIESVGTSGGFGFGIGSFGRHGSIALGTGNDVREYDEGSLVIDFLDPDSNDLLWRGSGIQRYREYKDPEKATRDINTLVETILKQFPPQK